MYTVNYYTRNYYYTDRQVTNTPLFEPMLSLFNMIEQPKQTENPLGATSCAEITHLTFKMGHCFM